MALPAVGSVTVNQETGSHSGSGMALELYEARRGALEATILSQPAFTKGDADPIALLTWIAADSTETASTIHEWLTEDAEPRVESPTDGTLTGVIT